MKKAIVSAASLATAGASLLGVLAISAGPATAKQQCVLKPKTSLAPYVTSPCNGTTLKAGIDVTFKATDTNSLAGKYHPYINVQTVKKMSHGHLVANTNGNGVFDEMKAVKGHKGQWMDVAKHQIYPSWWDNHKGTYYVQIQQIDSRAGTGGTFYSPIVTIHVS